MAWFYLELPIASVDSFVQGQKVVSPLQGPEGSFRMQLQIHPRGIFPGLDDRSISAYLRLVPSPEEEGSSWSCPDVELEIAMTRRNQVTGRCWRTRFADVHTFTVQ